MIYKFTVSVARVLSAALLLAAATNASASEIIYTPINPSFGGNPNNAPGLMNVAQAQNTFTVEAQTPLEIFNQSLQRSILSRLATQTLSTLFGTDRQLSVGTYETAGFIVDVTDDGTGILTITTTDKNTGDIVSFVVSDGGL